MGAALLLTERSANRKPKPKSLLVGGCFEPFRGNLQHCIRPLEGIFF